MPSMWKTWSVFTAPRAVNVGARRAYKGTKRAGHDAVGNKDKRRQQWLRCGMKKPQITLNLISTT